MSNRSLSYERAKMVCEFPVNTRRNKGLPDYFNVPLCEIARIFEAIGIHYDAPIPTIGQLRTYDVKQIPIESVRPQLTCTHLVLLQPQQSLSAASPYATDCSADGTTMQPTDTRLGPIAQSGSTAIRTGQNTVRYVPTMSTEFGRAAHAGANASGIGISELGRPSVCAVSGQ